MLLGLLNCNFTLASGSEDRRREEERRAEERVEALRERNRATDQFVRRREERRREIAIEALREVLQEYESVPMFTREDGLREIEKFEKRELITKKFNNLKARLLTIASSTNDIELDLKKEAQKLQADLLDSYRPAPARGNDMDEFVGMSDSLIPLQQYFTLHCLLKKENLHIPPSPEKIAHVSDRLSRLSRTIENYQGMDAFLQGDSLAQFNHGTAYVANFLNNIYEIKSESSDYVYKLEAFFDLVEEATKTLALRNQISGNFQKFKSAVEANKHNEDPTAYLLWAQICLARGNETKFDALELNRTSGDDIRNAIGSLIQDIKNEELHMSGLTKPQSLAVCKTFKTYAKTFKDTWTIEKYNETFTVEDGDNVVTERYWSKFLPNLVFYLHNLINADGASMDNINFPGARCITGIEQDLLVSAGRMLTGRMDVNIDFGDCRVVQ